MDWRSAGETGDQSSTGSAMSLSSYVTLGRSGLRVSPFTLGTMTFGEDNGWGAPPAESHRILAAYLDGGGNSVDTANVYTNGHSEAIIGDYLQTNPAVRDRIVLGTKFYWNLHRCDPNGGGPSRKGIIGQLHDSLRRLRTDYVDIYWLHNFDPVAPMDETMRTLDDLVTAGKVRYVAFSDTPAWATARAATMADFRGWVPLTAMQLEYSLLERTGEGELLPMARELGMGVMPWSPLAGGFLSGKYSSRDSGPVDTTRTFAGTPTPAQFTVIDEVNTVAAELGVSSAAVALAWVQKRPEVTSTLLGARSMGQLQTNLTALEVQLDADQQTRLENVSRPSLNFPAANNALFSRYARNAGATVDGEPTALPAQLISGTTW
jgi:aryl-alcohol dehydrogenase-like predicted oxidoreductase